MRIFILDNSLHTRRDLITARFLPLPMALLFLSSGREGERNFSPRQPVIHIYKTSQVLKIREV